VSDAKCQEPSACLVSTLLTDLFSTFFRLTLIISALIIIALHWWILTRVASEIADMFGVFRLLTECFGANHRYHISVCWDGTIL
jgi:hypothetical protein